MNFGTNIRLIFNKEYLLKQAIMGNFEIHFG